MTVVSDVADDATPAPEPPRDRWNEEPAVDRRTDPLGRPYYWIGGPPHDIGDNEGEDTWAVKHGHISVTPLVLDITAPDLGPTRQLLAGVTVADLPTGA